MSTETAPQSRGGVRRHKKLQSGSGNHGARQAMGAQWAHVGSLRTMATHCGCGCGTEINIAGRRIVEMRSQGRTLKSIAQEWDRPAANLRYLYERPVRFVKGHATKGSGAWLPTECNVCGKPIKVSPIQVSPPRCSIHKEWVDVQQRIRQGQAAVFRDVLDRVHAKRPIAQPPKRNARVVQADNRRLFDLELERAVNGATPELTALIDAQKAEALYERKQLVRYMRSLDAPLLSDRHGSNFTLYDKIVNGSNNRHTVEWSNPTEELALTNVEDWEAVQFTLRKI